MTVPKVIQIAVSGSEDSDGLYALCEDGSLWVCFWTGEQSPWKRLYAPYAPVPAPDEPAS